MNLGNLYTETARLLPHLVALIAGNDKLHYGELNDRTNQVANALAALGIGAGDHVAILIKNDMRFVESFFGPLRLGAIVTAVTTRAHYNTFSHIVRDCGAKVLIASRDFATEAARLDDEIAALEHVLVMDTPPDAVRDYDAWRDAAPTDQVDTPVDDDDIALLSYTAGSTGLPKGALLTHGGCIWTTRMTRKVFLLGPEDRCLLAAPMFHAAPLFLGITPMMETGGSLVILPDFDAAEMIRAIERERCTFTIGVPAMYKMLLLQDDLLAESDCSSLHFVMCGSAEVPEELLRGFEERMGAPMLEAFGMTECLVVLNNPRWGIRKQGTAGIPHPDVELRIVDPENPANDIPTGEIGELLVRSPAVTKGYHNLPEVTAERLLAGGWLRTRDLVRADDQGYVSIIGRQDDMISCGGESVYPKEVENVLMTHANVADVAVVPRSDDMKGQVPVAFVIEKRAGDSTPEELKNYFLDNGPAYAHPRQVHILDEMPLTAARKVDRIALRKMARG